MFANGAWGRAGFHAAQLEVSRSLRSRASNAQVKLEPGPEFHGVQLSGRGLASPAVRVFRLAGVLVDAVSVVTAPAATT